jgi:hypothetical protein
MRLTDTVPGARSAREFIMTRFLLIGSTIALTLISSTAFAGGGIRDHRHGGSRYGDPPGGVRVYQGYHAQGYRDPHISPAPAGGYGSGSTIRDHRDPTVRDHRSHHPHWGGYGGRSGGGATVRDHRTPYGGATVRDHRGLRSPLVQGPFF